MEVVVKTIYLGIQGMTCASCVARVERALKKSEGVDEVSVNLATEKAQVSFDPKRVDTRALLGIVEKAGYTPLTTETSFGVTGMTCVNCSSRVERKLGKVEGVLSATVNLATERATVRYLPDVVNVQTLHKVVEDTGYGVLKDEAGKDRVDAEREAREFERATLKRDLTMAVIFAAPLILLVMLPMFFPAVEAQMMRVVPTDHRPEIAHLQAAHAGRGTHPST